MKHRRSFVWFGYLVTVLLLGSIADTTEGQEAKSPTTDEEAPTLQEQTTEDVASPELTLPLYKPPAPEKLTAFKPSKRGKPGSRVGGGLRGTGEAAWPALVALVPEHVGQTVSAQPSLFWYIESIPQAQARLVFALIDDHSVEPIYETDIETPARAGIQQISLSDHGVKLDPEVEYEWSVALVVDPEKRSKDIIATGWIDRVEEPEGLTNRIQKGGKRQAVAAYAELGLWYDTLTAISDLIDENPGDVSLRESRRALLQQVGLEAVTRSEL
jgi:hypothetical protein